MTEKIRNERHGFYLQGFKDAQAAAKAEIERLTIENWQLKGALGYPVPSNIPEGDFKCGLCDARRKSINEQLTEEEPDDTVCKLD